jgi:hypothetical protein
MTAHLSLKQESSKAAAIGGLTWRSAPSPLRCSETAPTPGHRRQLDPTSRHPPNQG